MLVLGVINESQSFLRIDSYFIGYCSIVYVNKFLIDFIF